MVPYLTNEPPRPGPGPIDVPLFHQVAKLIADDIVDGVLAEGAAAPSSNELASFLRVNQATALKGINKLADDGVLVKRRGVGMFVTEGARQRLLEQRRQSFTAHYLAPILAEARLVGLSPREVSDMILKEADNVRG